MKSIVLCALCVLAMSTVAVADTFPLGLPPVPTNHPSVDSRPQSFQDVAYAFHDHHKKPGSAPVTPAPVKAPETAGVQARQPVRNVGRFLGRLFQRRGACANGACGL